ncbi:MAG: hypothetical protein AB1634_01440 [Thermodesulfobacteriota bacterium]
MRTCNLHDFMAELAPWLDGEHIRRVVRNEDGRLVVHFVDGMKNVYDISDCNRSQIENVLVDLKKKGITVD